MDTNSRLSQMEKKIFIMVVFIQAVWSHKGTLIERITYAEESVLSYRLKLIPVLARA